MPNSSKLDMAAHYQNWMNSLVHQFIIAVMVGREVAGESYLEKLEETFYNFGVKCAGYWTEIAGVKEAEPDCVALGKVMDAVDDSFANWWDGYVGNSPGAFEKHILNCPVAASLKLVPEYCERIVPATLRGILQTLNPKANITFSSFISKGDKTCHYRIETRD